MSTSDQDLSHLIELARRGEPGALDQMLGTYRNYLRLLARTGIDASLQGKADPSDVVQEALLKASQRFEQFRGSSEAELIGWLRQILAHSLTDLVRHYGGAGRQIRREQPLNQLLGRSSQALERILAVDALSPSSLVEKRDLGVMLSDVLDELSPDHREVIVLHNLEELGWDEVARRMGRSPDAARMLWVRALKQLRPLIEARLGPLPEGS